MSSIKNILEYDFDPDGPKHLVTLRLINWYAKNIGESWIYITPWVVEKELGIPLDALLATLYNLEEHELIAIDQKPNHKLTYQDRLRREDEEDEYIISIKKDFYGYYTATEQSAGFLKNDTSKPTITSKEQKPKRLEYDKHSQLLTYGNATLKITGPIRPEVCKQVFAKRTKKIPYNDILMIIDPTMDKQSRVIYDAVRGINDKIEEKFGLSSALGQLNEEVWLNRNYLR